MSIIYICKECGSEDIVICDYIIITKDGEEIMPGKNCFCDECDTRTEYIEKEK